MRPELDRYEPEHVRTAAHRVWAQLQENDGQVPDAVRETIMAREFSSEQRKKLADQGKALPDGSFPIVNKADLRNAVQAYGRAGNKSAAKKHIIKRARALGATDLLPDDWK